MEQDLQETDQVASGKMYWYSSRVGLRNDIDVCKVCIEFLNNLYGFPFFCPFVLQEVLYCVLRILAKLIDGIV